MVQKYQSPVRVYKHSFEMVMAAYQKRFPTCDMIPVFLGCEIMSDVESEDKSTHVVERRCKLNVDAPRLLKRVVGCDFVYFIQKNSLNRRDRTLQICAHNESFASRIVINENCQYTVHPDNHNWTCFEQSATMEVKSFFGFESTVEKIAIKQYAANIKKGKEIIEYYLNELQTDGTTYIPSWAEENPHLVNTLTPSCDGDADDDSCEAQERSRHQSFSSNAAAGDRAMTSCERVVGGKDDNLEEDYIEHNLGMMNPIEESKLIQLRKWLSDTHNGKIPRDEHILRFLRSRDFNMEKAREFLCQSLSWRKQHQIDKLLDTYKPCDTLKQYYLGGWHHHDNDGRPLYVLKLGQMDTKGLLKAVSEEQILRHILSIMEEGLRRCKETSVSANKPMSARIETCEATAGWCVSSWTCVVDLDGLSMRHLWRPGVQALLRFIEVIEANYPETMARLLIVRAPRVFPVLWTLISPFIDEKTSSKFMMYTGTEYLRPGGVVDYVPNQFIPDFLGGTCQCEIPQGGPVPKSLYRTEWESRGDGINTNLWVETIYKQACLSKGFPHEVAIEVPEKDSVLTWDFDSIKGDLLFTLYYSKKLIGPDDDSDVQCLMTSSGNQSTTGHRDTTSGNLTTIHNCQVISKNLVLGTDYAVVEPGIVCCEGESVQGSHVARHAGYYVMQWRLNAQQDHPSSTMQDLQDALFSVTHPGKAKLIYYHELLPSQNFRGSMSSLESCQSAFSSLTAGSR